MTTIEPTVEQCLEELREMFPGEPIFINDEVEWWAEDKEAARDVRVVVGQHCSVGEFKGATLGECMTKVRELYANQPSSTPDRKVRDSNERDSRH